MTLEARVRAVILPESRGHRGIGHVVNLMRSRGEEQRIHDARHVTGHAAAGLGVGAMTRVALARDGELGVALHAHPIGIVTKLQRRRVRGGVGRMGIVARTARGVARPKTLGPRERFADERRGPVAAVAVERLAREVRRQVHRIGAIKRHLIGVVDVAAFIHVVHRRLRVTLTADRDVLRGRQAAEAHRRVVGRPPGDARLDALDVIA